MSDVWPVDRDADGPATQPLNGVRVVDLSDRLSGAFAARLLGDFGADVVLAEPLAGHALRHEPPFNTEGDQPVSFLHAYANWNKRSQVVRSAGEVEALLSSADVVVTTGHSPALPEGIVELSITAHGLSGPLAGVPGNNLTACARTGWALMNAYADEPPLQLPVWQTGYLAGIVGFTAAAAALRDRNKHGGSQQSGYEQVEVSELEVMELTVAPWAIASVFRGVDTPHGPGGARPRDRPGPLFGAADGQICFSLGDFKNWTEAMSFMGLDEFATDPLYVSDFGRHQQDLKPVVARAAEQVRSMERWPLFHRLGELRCVSGCLHSLPGLLGDEQLLDRGFFVDADLGSDADDRTTRAPGFPARTTTEMWRLRHSAPALPAAGPPRTPSVSAPFDHGASEAQAEVSESAIHAPEAAPGDRIDLAVLGRPTVAAPAESTGAPPLAGVRILTFTQAWSGTLGTQLLAMLGADVVQIELLHKSDVWRNAAGSVPEDVADADRRQIPQNTQGLYNSVNLNKRAIALDLGTEVGRELFWQLVPGFDVIAENFAPHVMPKWGISLDTLSSARPDVIFASVSGYGSTGPYSQYPANGSTIEPMSGLSSIHGYGYGDGDGMNTGGLLPDPVTAFWLAAAVVAGLAERDQTGRPQRIDISMMESVSATIGHAIMEAAADGSDRPAPDGHVHPNGHPQYAPHGYFPACGGEWLALAAEDETSWRVIAERIGLADDRRFANASDRKTNEVDLTDAIAAWTQSQDADTLAEDLGSHGVAAARVSRGTEIFLRPDVHLSARGFLAEVEHPESGRNLLPGCPWTYSSRQPLALEPAPGVGQHSREVLCGELGLTNEEYDQLVLTGVTGTL